MLAHPEATLDAMLEDTWPDLLRPAAALLSAMVHEHGGTKAIAAFFGAGSETQEFKRGVARIFGKSWQEVAAEWKVRALRPPG